MNTTGRRPSLPALATIGAMVALTLTACSSTPDPAPPAEALAQALTTGDPGDVSWTDGPVDVTATLGELAELPRTVAVTEVGESREDGDGLVADVALEWSWDLDDDGETDWTYPTNAVLVTDGEASWSAVSDPAMVAEGLRPDGTIVLVRTTGERADVVDGNGSAIVTDRPVFRVGIDKTRIEGASEADLRENAEEVAALAGYREPAGFGDRTVAAGPRAFVEAIVVRESSDEVDLDAVREVPGGVALPDVMPLAPTAVFARALLGRAGPATQELIEQSEGRLTAGDVTGLSGLQQQYDPTLTGAPGLQVVEQHESGDVVLYERPAADGADLQVTLSVPVQEAAEAALAEVDAPAGLVAIRPSTGEVLAAASGPGSEGHNTAMLASVAPGSTYKLITALALLRAGTGPEDTVMCAPEATVDGYTISNYPDYPASSLGEITMTEAIAHSCNTALVSSVDQLSADAMGEAAEALGLGRELAGDWPGFLGSYPQDATGTGLAASLIGQGEVLASPLAMATAAASIQAGATVTPTLVLGPDEVADDADGPAAPSVPLSEDEAAVLRGYMAAVVTDGTGILLSDVPGEPVHAKTGSAEAGGGDDSRVDSWMTAYQGDVAVAVFVQGAGHGSGVAGGVVEELLRSLG
ncbi:penicillin-binding transpeptidase domain-containing protein [Georgenia sp. MJ173]|uniref:penicillin-binding transpeptidase domain-containing protein n=1 Tax=Georgenia sunbinii TaxID=3117728 RepID=UPI002F2608E9